MHKCTVATVIDRGPYGAYVDEGELAEMGMSCQLRPGGRCWYVKKRASWPGRWRGCLDLTPAAAAAIGHNGFQRVVVWRYK